MYNESMMFDAQADAVALIATHPEAETFDTDTYDTGASCNDASYTAMCLGKLEAAILNRRQRAAVVKPEPKGERYELVFVDGKPQLARVLICESMLEAVARFEYMNKVSVLESEVSL
jgi:hypothetical protein